MLKVWNVSLIVATFTLCLLGTFLVRSGVIESIHAFGVSKVGGPLLALIAVVLLGSVALIVSRLDDLQIGAPHRLAAVARVDLPRQQPAPRRALRRRLLGHVLPADLGGGHRHALVGRRAVLQPRRPAARDPARALHRNRAAGRVAPGLVGVRRGASSAGPPPSAALVTRGARRVQRRARRPALAGAVRVRRVRARGAGAGVREGGLGAPRARRRLAARGARSRSSRAIGAATAATSSTPGSC